VYIYNNYEWKVLKRSASMRKAPNDPYIDNEFIAGQEGYCFNTTAHEQNGPGIPDANRGADRRENEHGDDGTETPESRCRDTDIELDTGNLAPRLSDQFGALDDNETG
jgi:hypothetical protein